LGACGFGPVAQINDRYYENLKPQDVSALIHTLQAEGQ
jgi:NADH-quinone oxidoreductase subunit E